MKGLVYKEFYLGKKTLRVYGIVLLMITLLGMLVCLSMDCGNLKELVTDYNTKSFYAKIFFYVPYIVFLMSIDIVVNSVFSDYSVNWMNYSYTLPLSAAKTIGAKYIVAGIIMFCGFGFGVLNGLLVGHLSGVEYSFDVLKNQAILLVVTVAGCSTTIAFAYRARTKDRLTTRVVSVFGILYFGIGVLAVWAERKYGFDEEGNSMLAKWLKEKLVELWKQIAPVMPVLIILWVVAWFYDATRVYKRREKA